jgi:hypothetical protein
MASVMPKYVRSRSSVAAKQSLIQGTKVSPREMPNKSLQLTFDSPLGLATPSPLVDPNAAELMR